MRVEDPDSDVVVARHLVPRWRILLWALVAFIGTPFVLTGLYRLTPDVPAWWVWPFAVVGSAAVALGWWRARWRPVSAAVLVSAAMWAVFLLWLLSTFGS